MDTCKRLILSDGNVPNGVEIKNDNYGVAEYALQEPRRSAFLHNPYLTADDNRCMLCLSLVDDVVAGRIMLFPTQFKADKEIIESSGGSSLYVESLFRHTDVGVDLVFYPIDKKKYNALIYSDFSEEGLKVYRALKFTDFSLGKMILPVKLDFLLAGALGSKLSRIVSFPFNMGLRLWRKIFSLYYISPNCFDLKKMDVVPKWVDDIVLNDGHKYMEVHDHIWIQWNLDNMFHNDPENENAFYGVFCKEKPIGFILIKTRKRKKGGRSFLQGSIMEWGSYDESRLSEAQLYLLALRILQRNVDFVQVATNNINTMSVLKKLLFIGNGEHHIMFKDLSRKYKDSNDPSLWRLRYGYSDSILN